MGKYINYNISALLNNINKANEIEKMSIGSKNKLNQIKENNLKILNKGWKKLKKNKLYKLFLII